MYYGTRWFGLQHFNIHTVSMHPSIKPRPKNTLEEVHRVGWSEPAATNALVEDEPVQPVLRMNILPARRDFFFHLLFAPKFSTSPLLPTTYQPHPPSLHRHSSRDLEPLCNGSWSYGCGAGARATGARAGPAGVGAKPTRPRKGKMFFFFFFFLFVLFEEDLLHNDAWALVLQQRCCSVAQRCWSNRKRIRTINPKTLNLKP
jgi:hypothetical protein